MDRYEERFCGTCGSSSESLKYQIPPHSVKTSTKFCPDCGAIISNDPRKYTKAMPHADYRFEFKVSYNMHLWDYSYGYFLA